MDILLIIAAVFLIIFLYNYFKQKHIPNNTVLAFTGALGSGKSFLAVRTGIKYFKRTLRTRALFRLIPLPVLGFGKKYLPEEPQFYSSIPVYIGRLWIFFGKKRWATQLEEDHLLLNSRIVEYSVVFIDEIGAFASQHDWDSPFVMIKLQEFMRFFRHYVDGLLILTDQSSSNIVVDIRRRINQIYHLSDFRKYFFMFYKINVSEIHITEDLINMRDADEQEQPYFFGFVPMKWMYLLPFFTKHYDSRCYSINYLADYADYENIWSKLKTNYFIEMPNSDEMRKEYKKQGFITNENLNNYMYKWKNRNTKSVPSDKLPDTDEL
jgi:hypothetical protein